MGKDYPFIFLVHVTKFCCRYNVMFANEMNCIPLTRKLQYDFFINIVLTPQKVFCLGTRNRNDKIWMYVKQYYGYRGACEVSDLSPTQLDGIKTKLNKGGKKI